jgi:hypothetical protein
MRHAFLHQVKNGPQIDIHHFIPIVKVRIFDRAIFDYARGVDQDIDLAKPIDRLRNQPVDLRRLADVREQRLYTSLRALRFIAKIAQLFFISPDGYNPRTVPRKKKGRCAPDPAACTRDHSNLVLHKLFVGNL